MRGLSFVLLLLWQALPAQAAPRLAFEAQLEFVDERAQLRLDACSAESTEVLVWRADLGRPADLIRVQRSSEADVEWRGDRLLTRNWQAGECLQLLINLQAIAERDRWRLGYRADRFVRVALGAWLWRPEAIHADSTMRFAQPEGWAVSAPWPADDEGVRRLGSTPAHWPATVAWWRGKEQRIAIRGGELRLAVLPTMDAPPPQLDIWMRRTVDNLLTSAPRWPVGSTQVLLVPLPEVRSPVPWGQVTRGGAAAVHLFLGAAVSESERLADWTATHEFAHLLHPFMGDRGRWLAEGMASYYQNVARARSGELSAARAWDKLRAGFRRGEQATPEGAATLAGTSRQRRRGSTMRIYWSGAAFWLQTDLALRAKGSSLDQLLAQFAQRHLPSVALWSPDAFIAALARLSDDTAGLEPRFRRYQARQDFPDLAEIFADDAALDWPSDRLDPRLLSILRADQPGSASAP